MVDLRERISKEWYEGSHSANQLNEIADVLNLDYENMSIDDLDYLVDDELKDIDIFTEDEVYQIALILGVKATEDYGTPDYLIVDDDEEELNLEEEELGDEDPFNVKGLTDNPLFDYESKAKEEYDAYTGKFDVDNDYYDAMGGNKTREEVEDMKAQIRNDLIDIEDEQERLIYDYSIIGDGYGDGDELTDEGKDLHRSYDIGRSEANRMLNDLENITNFSGESYSTEDTTFADGLDNEREDFFNLNPDMSKHGWDEDNPDDVEDSHYWQLRPEEQWMGLVDVPIPRGEEDEYGIAIPDHQTDIDISPLRMSKDRARKQMMFESKANEDSDLPAGWTQDQVDLFYDGGDIDEPNDDEAELYDLIRDREDSKENITGYVVFDEDGNTVERETSEDEAIHHATRIKGFVQPEEDDGYLGEITFDARQPIYGQLEESEIEPMSPEELKKYKGKLGGDELGYSDDMKDYQAQKEQEEEEVEETGVSSDEYPQDRKDNTVNIPFTEAQLLQKGSESYKVLENNASIRFE